jgi:DNA-binding transcriptional LysR family regulator
MPSVGPLRLAPFLAQFGVVHQAIELALVEGEATRLEELLLGGSLDVAVMTHPRPARKRLRHHPLSAQLGLRAVTPLRDSRVVVEQRKLWRTVEPREGRPACDVNYPSGSYVANLQRRSVIFVHAPAGRVFGLMAMRCLVT